VSPESRAGFTAIETVVSIVILSIVGLLIGQTLLQTSHSAVKSSESKRAAALSEMVLEQYTAYAAQDYSHLASYDRDRVAPKEFFGTKDDLGYDNLRITTHTLPKESGGADVTVLISWGRGTSADTLTFTKTFAGSVGSRSSSEMSGI
jgi:type II secretory pathway pseudopilin PulG